MVRASFLGDGDRRFEPCPDPFFFKHSLGSDPFGTTTPRESIKYAKKVVKRSRKPILCMCLIGMGVSYIRKYIVPIVSRDRGYAN